MARPYQRIGRILSEPVTDHGTETTWDRITGVQVPMAPGVDMPLCLNRNLEYLFQYTERGWVLSGRAAGKR